ncbi:hypothetical protein MASR2M54_05080 [Aliarcobacter cryaerophilus]
MRLKLQKQLKKIILNIYNLENEINKGIISYMSDTFLQIDENMYAVPIGFLK